jgi:shikimate O-hydroxycinnamoyltransferase
MTYGLWKTIASQIKRFVFDAKTIETSREKARGESDLKPSRTLSGFLGKRYMATSLALSGSPRPCILRYVVNLRARTEPLLFDGAIGNLFRTVGAVSKPEAGLELHELAIIISESVTKMDHQDFLKSLQGDEGFN